MTLHEIAIITPEEARLLNASLSALAAYRAIFGRHAWNGRDRAAFHELEQAALAFAQTRRFEERITIGEACGLPYPETVPVRAIRVPITEGPPPGFAGIT